MRGHSEQADAPQAQVRTTCPECGRPQATPHDLHTAEAHDEAQDPALCWKQVRNAPDLCPASYNPLSRGYPA